MRLFDHADFEHGPGSPWERRHKADRGHGARGPRVTVFTLCYAVAAISARVR
jgi:hypothetical protein